MLIRPYSFRVCLSISNSKNIDSSRISLLYWPCLGWWQSCGLRDPCFSLSIIGFTKMNKHLVKNFLASRNSQGRSRDAKERMIRKTCQVMRFWRQIKAREEGWWDRGERRMGEFWFSDFAPSLSLSEILFLRLLLLLDFQMLSNVANFSFTKVIPHNVIDFNFTKVVS